MLLLSVSEFRSNMSKYLKMANSERIAIKSPSGIFDITPSKEIRVNPSPSGDAFYDIPENVEHLDRVIKESGERKPSEFISLDDFKNKMRSNDLF